MALTAGGSENQLSENESRPDGKLVIFSQAMFVSFLSVKIIKKQ